MTGDQVQNCPICFADFNQLDVLIEHAETCGSLPVINTSSNGPRCPVCAKKFLEYDSKYEMHVLSCVDLSCSVDASSPVKAIVSASSAVRAATDNPKLAKVIANRSLVPSKEILHSHNNSLNIPGGIAVLSGALRGEYPFASRKMPRQCPQYKRIHGTRFTMDAFRYGTIPECTAYFLSHFHSDHYGGLTKSFTGQIYTNAITAKLVIQQLGVNADLITILEMNVENVVGNAKVTLIDANHCPGAAIYLFEVAKANDVLRILHTGDFRACSDHLTHPTLLRNGKLIDIDILYLDTTYCKPEHVFPSQKDVIDVVVDVAERFVLNKEPMQAITNKNTLFSFLKFPEKKKQKVCTDTVAGWLNLPDPNSISDTLVVVGTYLIGKEKIFISVAQALKSKIWADSNKRRIYKSQDNSILNDLLVTDPHKANVHILPLTKLDKPTLLEHLSKFPRFKHILGIRPTGWTFGKGSTGSFTRYSINVKYLDPKVTLVPVPYSEHSSFSDLELFCTSLRVSRIIPTVPGKIFDTRQWELPNRNM